MVSLQRVFQSVCSMFTRWIFQVVAYSLPRSPQCDSCHVWPVSHATCLHYSVSPLLIHCLHCMAIIHIGSGLIRDTIGVLTVFYQAISCLGSWLLVHDNENINALRPRQCCCHFADNIFKCIFLNENVWISLEISMIFVPGVRINNIPALFSDNGLALTRRQANI